MKNTVIIALSFILSASCFAEIGTTPEAAEKLNFIWRSREISVNVNRMSSSDYFEYLNNNEEGAYYYISADQTPGTVPLYRLYHSGLDDYMTSTRTDELGYALDITLGYAYTNQLPGTVEITRWYDSSSDDHAIRRPGEAAPDFGSYTAQNLPDTVYGYPRYGLSDSADMLSLTGGGVEIKSNKAAGGAIFSWMYGGKEFININDYGRQLQAAYFAPHTEGEVTWATNPTEAGSRWTFSTYGDDRKQGSPIITATNVGLTQITRAVPLDFTQNESFGGGVYNPIIWPTASLGKDITLDYNGMGAVAKYETHLRVPADVGAGAWHEIPTAYMTGDFTRFWTYNAETSALALVTPASNTGGLYQAGPDFDGIHYGGVIISLPGDNTAMGVYAVSLEKGGSMTHMNLYNFTGIGGGGNPLNNATAKWAVGTGGFGFDDDYEYIFTTWVICGTLAEVTAHMDSLYVQGAIGAPRATPIDPNNTHHADTREDAVVFKPSTGVWQGSHNQPTPDYITGATTSESSAFGTSGDTPLVGDVDGDGLDDIVTVHPAGNYNWSASHTTDADRNGAGEMVGGSADSILTGFGTVSGSLGHFLADVTGDGIDDAVTINNGLNWYCKPSTEGVGFDATTSVQGPSQWGLPGDIVFVGDFNGDGYADTAVWRPSNAYWYIKKSGPGGLGTGGTVQGAFGLPNSDDIPMVGDVNGDGRTDGIIVRPSGDDLTWIAGFADATGKIDWATGEHNSLVAFGTTNDAPIVADINGDGRVDIGYISDNGSGQLLWKFALTNEEGGFTAFAMVSALFGDTGDVPLIGQLDYVDVRISSISTSGAGMVIEWEPSISNRLYTVNWNTNLVTGDFLPLETDIESPQNSYTDTVHEAENQCFYNVEIQ
ncbi:MAG: hypothetical protein DRP64_06405 [Verrucomicrobia bacterium]|nr:MAG: hypothetical protein DRP64_06405 [Verrucomicrobiota bacterium]